jgi:hypothetical protein
MSLGKHTRSVLRRRNALFGDTRDLAEAEQVIKKGRRPQVAAPADLVREQVPSQRREEIRRYLMLFGYKPERTILQVHDAGTFGRRSPSPREAIKRAETVTRYKGRTFTVLGRTHDPSIREDLLRPLKSRDPNPGYLGYFFMGKDPRLRPPDELIPLDVVPASLNYPQDWKDLFQTKGFLIAMHVPSSFAAAKNDIHNRLRRIRGDIDPKKKWGFLDELEEYGYFSELRASQ